jgi:parallel beta-helix repeat protein
VQTLAKVETPSKSFKNGTIKRKPTFKVKGFNVPEFTPAKGKGRRLKTLLEKLKDEKEIYCYVQFNQGILTPGERTELENKGWKFLYYVPDDTYVVRVPKREIIRENSQIRSIDLMDPSMKMGSGIRHVLRMVQPVEVTIYFYDPPSAEELENVKKTLINYSYFPDSDNDALILHGVIAPKDIPKVLDLNYVEGVEIQGEVILGMDQANDLISSGFVWKRGKDGSGATVGIIDSGILSQHPHFYDPNHPKVTIYKAYDWVDNNMDPEAECGDYDSTNGVYNCENGINDDGDTFFYPQQNNYISKIDEGLHGVHVAGIIAGWGTTADGREIKGVAPKANLVIERIFDRENGKPNTVHTENDDIWRKITDPEGDGDFAEDSSADVVSLSWGSYYNKDGTYIDGTYTGTSRQIDRLVKGKLGRKVVVVALAGNDGQQIHNKVWNTGTAKNAITVGAVGDYKSHDNNDQFQAPDTKRCSDGGSDYCQYYTNELNVMEYSSYGTADGRVKPDILAPGSDITSAWEGGYRSKWGTSMATPVVAGVAAQVLQQWGWAHPFYLDDLEPAAVKAVMITNAVGGSTTDAPNPRIGWGRLDAYSTVFELEDEVDLTVVSDVDFSDPLDGPDCTTGLGLTVPSGAKKLIVTLAWDDMPSEITTDSGLTLKNDLDLYLENPSGSTLLPNGHDTKNDDDKNNVEKYVIDNPSAGNWKIYVEAKALYHTQTYAVSWRIITPTQTPSTSVTAHSSSYTIPVGSTFDVWADINSTGLSSYNVWAEVSTSSSGLTLESGDLDGTEAKYSPLMDIPVDEVMQTRKWRYKATTTGTKTITIHIKGKRIDGSDIDVTDTVTVEVKDIPSGLIDNFENEINDGTVTTTGSAWGDWTYEEQMNSPSDDLHVVGTSDGYSGNAGSVYVFTGTNPINNRVYIKRDFSYSFVGGSFSIYTKKGSNDNLGDWCHALQFELTDSSNNIVYSGNLPANLAGGTSSYSTTEIKISDIDNYRDATFDWNNIQSVKVRFQSQCISSSDYNKIYELKFDDFRYTPSVPEKPSNVVPTPQSYDTIQIDWDDSPASDGVDRYKIFRGTTELGETTTSDFTDSGLNDNTQYCYKVQAHNSQGWGTNSTLSCATTPEYQNTPSGTNVTVDLGSGNSILFSTISTGGNTLDSPTTDGSQWNPIDGNYIRIGDFHNITTTAVPDGNITITLFYPENLVIDETNLELLHYNGLTWDVITTGRDTVNSTISGITTSLSPFVVVEKDLYPPVISIFSPANMTYGTTSVDLNYSVSDPGGVDWVGCSIDGSANVTLTGNITLAGLSDGPHNVVLYANDSAGNMASSTVYFTVDTTPPTVTITSPQSTVYNTNSVALEYSVADSTGVAWTGYSLDGQGNVTLTGSTTLTGLSDGQHQVTVYSNDTLGNLGSASVSFTVDTTLDTTPPSITSVSHSPLYPSEQDPITISAEVGDNGILQQVLVHYTTDGWATTMNRVMTTTAPHSQLYPGVYEDGKGKVKKKEKDKKEEKKEKKKKKKVLVKYKPGKKPEKSDVEKLKGREVEDMEEIDTEVVEVDDVEEFKKAMEKHPGVEAVREAVVYHALAVPDDPYYPEQWNLVNINAAAGWDHTLGANATIAIIDTGVDYLHPDLDDNVVPGYDWVNSDSDPMDDNGHGTHVAGIAAAEMNGLGLVGTSPGSKILALKVLDAAGTGYDYDVAAAIINATDAGADIISLSLGGGYSKAMEDACNYAYNRGVLLVAAAGNTGGEVLYPAALDTVIAVSAVNSDNTLPSYSARGPAIELAAPGGGDRPIYSTYLNASYAWATGTSMAAPHVSGVAALLKSLHPDWTNQDIRAHLRSTALDLGDTGRDDLYGYGLVNAAELAGGTPQQPTPPSSTYNDSRIELTLSGELTEGVARVTVSFTAKEKMDKVHLEDTLLGGSIRNVTSSRGEVKLKGKDKKNRTGLAWKLGEVKAGETHTLTFEMEAGTCVDTGARVEGKAGKKKYKSGTADPLCFPNGTKVSDAFYVSYYADIGNFPKGTTIEYYITAHDQAGNMGSTQGDVRSIYVSDTSKPTVVVHQASKPPCTNGKDSAISITEAVRIAAPGDSVVVCPGTYYDNVEVDKPLTIESYSQDYRDTIIVAEEPTMDVFRVIHAGGPPDSRVRISGFTIRGASMPEASGILVETIENGEFTNNRITGNFHGIVLRHSNRNTIESNLVESSIGAGIVLEYYSFDNTIYNNMFKNDENFQVSPDMNTWNTNPTPGTNIVDGGLIAGNYWGRPDGTGFSDTCPDWDRDGICDMEYELAPGNMDHFPLSAPLPDFVVVQEPAPPCAESNMMVPTITDAVNMAQEGDTIVVCPGTYTENVKIEKSLTIKSYGQDYGNTIVEAQEPFKDVFSVRANSVEISGFTIRGASDGSGIYASKSGGEFTNNRITENFYGIRLYKASSNTVMDNVVEHNPGRGIILYKAQGNTIRNNKFNNYMNIEFQGPIYENQWSLEPPLPGTNIVGGGMMGGNYWGRPDGTGFSDTCPDWDRDDICDMEYYLGPDNVDHYPLAVIRPDFVVTQGPPHEACVQGSMVVPTITDAVNMALEGDTIVVCPGTYTDNVYISKPLTLKSYSQDYSNTIVTAQDPTMDVFRVMAPEVTITGFTIRGANAPGAAGIRAEHSTNSHYSNNHLTDNTHGLYLMDSMMSTVDSNVVDLNGGSGILMEVSPDSTIYNNLFKNYFNIHLVTPDPNTWNLEPPLSGTNIVGGGMMGGNYWGDPNGMGFSDTCPDWDRDGICDMSYDLGPSNTDHYPLSNQF